MGQPQTGQRPDVLVRVLLQDRAQERLVLLAETKGDPLAGRAELVAADVVALQQREGLDGRVVIAHEVGRPGGGVHLPDRLGQGVDRDGVVGVFLGQFDELQRELVTEFVHLADELQSLLVRPDDPARRRLVLLEERLELFRRGGRLVLAFSRGRRRQAEHKNQDYPNNSLHGSASRSVEATRIPRIPSSAMPAPGSALEHSHYHGLRMRHASSSFPTQMKNGCRPGASAAWSSVTGLVPNAITRPSAKPTHWPRY